MAMVMSVFSLYRISSKTRRLMLQSPAAQSRVMGIDYSSSIISPQQRRPPPDSPLGYCVTTPMAFTAHRRGLVVEADHMDLPCKKLFKSSDDGVAVPTPVSLTKITAPSHHHLSISYAKRIWNRSQLSMELKPKLLAALALRHMLCGERQLGVECLLLSISEWNVSTTITNQSTSTSDLQFLLYVLIHAVFRVGTSSRAMGMAPQTTVTSNERQVPSHGRDGDGVVPITISVVDAAPAQYCIDMISFLVCSRRIPSQWSEIAKTLSLPSRNTSKSALSLANLFTQTFSNRLDVSSNRVAFQLLCAQYETHDDDDDDQNRDGEANTRSMMRSLLMMDKSHPFLLNNYAVLLMRQGDFASAIPVLKTCLEALSSTKCNGIMMEHIRANLFVSLSCNGDVELAQDLLPSPDSMWWQNNKDSAFSRFSVAAQLIDSCPSASSQSPSSSRRLKVLEHAVLLLKASLEDCAADNEDGTRAYRCRLHTYLGKAFVAMAEHDHDAQTQKHHTNAAESFMSAVDCDDSQVMAWNEFGRLSLVELDCKSPVWGEVWRWGWTWRWYVTSCFETVAKSERIFNSTLNREPSHAAILTNYGISLHLGSKLDEAEKVYERALSIDPRW